jgi:hypothetical protein
MLVDFKHDILLVKTAVYSLSIVLIVEHLTCPEHGRGFYLFIFYRCILTRATHVGEVCDACSTVFKGF